MTESKTVWGGGSEGEEWIRCTQKVMPVNPWWRRFPANKIFSTLQGAMNDIT
jgi:hypothetical protein